MRTRMLIAGVASLGLMSSPALANGLLGQSGNMPALLSGKAGGHDSSNKGWGGHQSSNWGKNGGGGQHGGGHNGDGSSEQQSSQSSKSYRNSSQSDSSRKSGSQYKESSFNQRDTTIGGVYANPQVDSSKTTKSHSRSSETKSGGCGQCGSQNSSSNRAQSDMSKKTFSASFPVAVESTTIGGFSSHKKSGSTWDNRNQSSRESTSYKHQQSQQSSKTRH